MHRREFLKRGLLTPAGLLAQHVSPQVLKAATDFRNLKINVVDVFPLKTGSIFVLVRTNEGITGLGECSPMNARVIVSMLRDALVPMVLGGIRSTSIGFGTRCFTAPTSWV